MKRPIYVDTGFWIALIDARDRHHDNARQVFTKNFGISRIVTSEIVIGETVTYLNCSLKRHDLAVMFLDHMDSAPLQVLEYDAATRIGACAVLRLHAGIPLSYADCISFALMRNHGISMFAGYNGHFIHMGFQPVCQGLPGQ